MKTTHTQQRKDEAKSLKQQIMELLQWKEQTYCDHQYNTGLQYLYLYIPGDPIGMEYLTRSKIFWNWWKNKWADRDLEFIEWFEPKRNAGKLKLQSMVVLYLQHHDAQMLSEDIKPCAVVLGNSYARMYQDVIDNEILASPCLSKGEVIKTTEP